MELLGLEVPAEKGGQAGEVDGALEEPTTTATKNTSPPRSASDVFHTATTRPKSPSPPPRKSPSLPTRGISTSEQLDKIENELKALESEVKWLVEGTDPRLFHQAEVLEVALTDILVAISNKNKVDDNETALSDRVKQMGKRLDLIKLSTR